MQKCENVENVLSSLVALYLYTRFQSLFPPLLSMVEETCRHMLWRAIVGIAQLADFWWGDISTSYAEEPRVLHQLLDRAGEWLATVSCSIGIMGVADPKDRNCRALPYCIITLLVIQIFPWNVHHCTLAQALLFLTKILPNCPDPLSWSLEQVTISLKSGAWYCKVTFLYAQQIYANWSFDKFMRFF